jgi:signal transduction histidine kinase
LKQVNGFDKTVFCLAKNAENTLFFGTEDGLFQFKNEKITRVRFASELASNFINFLNYRDGVLYVGTNNGLYLLSGKDLLKSPKIIQIGLTDGLIDLETNLNSSFFDNKGDFWFGTSSGLVRFNPKKFNSFRPNIKLNLREILLNYQTTDFTKYSDKVDNNNIPLGLILPYNENNLLFNFDGISISRFSNLDFQYWLEGLEENWSPPSKNTSVSFSSLPAGDYILHARILDSNGNAKDEIAFAFTIKSPFYATWWFITLLVLAVGAIVISIFRFRIKREKEISANEMVAVKARLVSLEQQSLNASMNRHFIFNSLNSIQYFINKSDKLAANKYLTNFAKLIRKNLDSSAEKNSMVTLSQEIERIELYLSLEAMRFKDRFEYSIQNEGVDLESISIPAMLIQPFVENSIIHGILPNEEQKGKIVVKTYFENGDLYILVEDNGIGIDKSISQKSNLHGDHKSQGMEITVKRLDLIKLVSNQHLELIGPEQINNSDGSINGTRVLLKIMQENLEN